MHTPSSTATHPARQSITTANPTNSHIQMCADTPSIQHINSASVRLALSTVKAMVRAGNRVMGKASPGEILS